MIQAIDSEQVLVTNLEHFMTKADKSLATLREREMMQELKNLLSEIKNIESSSSFGLILDYIRFNNRLEHFITCHSCT